MYTIDELKNLIKDRITLQGITETFEIVRFPNNVIRIDGRLVSWKHLENLLSGGEYKLILPEQKKSNWGGLRSAGPGKKIGRNPAHPDMKKKPRSFAMSENDIQQLEYLCKRYGYTKSQMVVQLIKEKIRSIQS